jgi:hypothetical protein
MDFLQGAILALVSAVAANVLLVPASIAIYKRTRPRREVYYNVSSTALVDPEHFSDGPLYVSVDRSQIDGAGGSPGTLEKVEAAYLFSVTVGNTGSETIDNLSIRIKLDARATPVRYRSGPPSGPGYKVTVVPDNQRPGLLTFLFPYINPEERAYAEVLTIGNQTGSIDATIRAHNTRILTFDEYFDRKYPLFNALEKWIFFPLLAVSLLLMLLLLAYSILAAFGVVPPMEGGI